MNDSKGGWKKVPLGTLAEFRNGINYNKDNFGKGTKVINVKDFQNLSLAPFEDLDEINPDGIVKEESFLHEGDIIFVRSNGNRQLIGRSLFVSNPPEKVTHSAFTIRTRFVSKQAFPRFFAYVFRSNIIRQYLSAYGSGTNISNLNQNILSNLEVPLLPFCEQKKIASILSNYDDLIENNTRRIEILENMAKLVYEEWFIKFRFPGHENVKMISSELGEIPEGWKVDKLGFAVELAYGKSLTAKDRTGGSFPVYGSAGVVGTHNEFMVNGPGIIVGRKGNVGSIFWCNENFFPIDTVFYVKTNIPLHYVYYNLKNQNFINNDAAVPGLNRNQAYLLPFLIPEDNTLMEFEKNVDPVFKEIDLLSRKNQNLRKTRDLLLPKLISGEIDISDLDIRIRNEFQKS